MKKMLTALLAAAVAGALFIAAPLTAAPPGTENYNKNTQLIEGDCEGPMGTPNQDDTLTIAAPANLWPPNHKYYTGIEVTATDGSGDPVHLTTIGYHDQWDGDTETSGSGNTLDDIRTADGEPGGPDGTRWVAMESADGSVMTEWWARAERAGRDADKTGRTYTLEASSTSDDGDSCTATVTFNVPHDMRPSNR